MPFTTELTRRLGLRVPVIAAPLGRGSTPDFLAALAGAGSMGFVALMHMPEPEVRQSLSAYLAATGGGERFGVNLTLIVDQSRRLDAALDAGCRVVSLWQGDPAPYVRRAKDAGATVFWTVTGPVEAARAADFGVDFIVCQGREAGGHLVGEAPLMALLPAVVDASRGVPVVAAGGVADGRGLAAVLALGACGAWLGTRFVASAESGNHPGHKRRITEAGFADLAETTLFDGGWPDIRTGSSATPRWMPGKPPAVLRLARGQVRANGSAPFRTGARCCATTWQRRGRAWKGTGQQERSMRVLLPPSSATWNQSPRSWSALKRRPKQRCNGLHPSGLTCLSAGLATHKTTDFPSRIPPMAGPMVVDVGGHGER